MKNLDIDSFYLQTRRFDLFRFLLLIILLPTSFFTYANSDERMVVNDLSDIKQGSLLFKGEDYFTPAAQLKLDVSMQVTGLINRVKVIQEFSNTTNEWQEAIYVFPLPNEAAVDHMLLKIGDRLIEGQIKKKKDAKRIYENAKRDGKHAALTEQDRPNIFTTSVSNISPGQTVYVEIEYQEIVSYDSGTFSLRFPMVVAPRYIPGKQTVTGFDGSGWAKNTDQVVDATRITPPITTDDIRQNNVSIKIDLNSGFALDVINSPYHQIATTENNNQYQIQLQQESTLANRDFVLSWQIHPSDTPSAALFTEQKQDATYAMIMMVPPTQNRIESLNREIIYVIDTSGSMGGQSILQAKAALELALSRLKPSDRFNVIQFNSYTSSLFSESRMASSNNIQSAVNYVRHLQANGGTEIAPALSAALDNQQVYEINDQNIRQVIFLTDGSIGNEQALFDIINKKLGQSRLFTIGIGSAPNSHFMQRAAEFGRGTHTYIGNLNEVKIRMQALFDKIENPILKDIKTSWGSETQIESWPQKVSDLYRGEPLLIIAKADTLPDRISISGQLAQNEWAAELKLNGGQDRSGVSTLWARQKIASLMQAKRDEEFDSVNEIIIKTALTHHLVSQYTSLVAVDVTPTRPIHENINSKTIPNQLPAGWVPNSNSLFPQSFPATATNARVQFLIGLLLFLLATFAYLQSPQRQTYRGEK